MQKLNIIFWTASTTTIKNSCQKQMTAKEIWKVLINKYMKKLQTIKRQYLTKFMNYKKFFDMSIEETYTNIFKKNQKIAII